MFDLFIIVSPVPLYGPHLYGRRINLFQQSVHFRLRPIDDRYIQGKLLGYSIEYFLETEQNNSIAKIIGANATQFTVTGLKEGSYIIRVAGFTRRGIGRYSQYTATCKYYCCFKNRVLVCTNAG